MGEFMLLIGFLGFLASLVMLIISFIRKRSKRTAAIITGVAFFLFIVGAVISGPTEGEAPPPRFLQAYHSGNKAKLHQFAAVWDFISQLHPSEFRGRIKWDDN